jgi:hypothetical protein
MFAAQESLVKRLVAVYTHQVLLEKILKGLEFYAFHLQ